MSQTQLYSFLGNNIEKFVVAFFRKVSLCSTLKECTTKNIKLTFIICFSSVKINSIPV